MTQALVKVDNTVKAARLKASVSLLNMFAERYLGLETPTSSKMALEISAAWNCRPVVE
ncbi:hypothetical protein [Salinarimonas sp.]|uniref:hypothetical protein n=1 Tax=Salinarimonas sp. TaxID=2766526 RepID=UPI0032D8B572